MKCIPAIDVFEGNVVRLYQGDYGRVTRYRRSPVECAERIREAGLRTLHVVDLNAARGDAHDNQRIVAELAGVPGLKVQVGGGIRNEERLARMLDAGAARAVVGSVAVREPERVVRWMDIFGAERIVPALDVRINDGTPEALVQGWQESGGCSLWDLLDIYRPAGLRKLLCTDVSRDGTLTGANTWLYGKILTRLGSAELQASGGVGSMADLETLGDAGVQAAIIGRAWLEERIPLADLGRMA